MQLHVLVRNSRRTVMAQLGHFVADRDVLFERHGTEQ